MDADTTNMYGQRSQPEETPELLLESHASLLDEIDNLPDEIKAGWMMAQEKCHPSLVGEEHRLMFLRCELFDTMLAARRISKYWNKRIELFGEDRAFKPLHLGTDGALYLPSSENDDVASIMVKCTLKGLSLGIIRPMQTQDSDGRVIVFVDPSRFVDYDKTDNDERMGVARSLWLVVHRVIVGNDTAQKKGVVVIASPQHAQLSFIDPKLMKINLESLSGCLPIRVGGFHICHPPWFFGYIVFPLVKLIVSTRMWNRIHIHLGSEDEVLENLKRFGLYKNALPSEIGGDVVL